MEVQAAAISMGGNQFAVVHSGPELLTQQGEADMTIERLQPVFGGVPVVLMALMGDGSPRYYGDADLVALLAGVPVDQMPWKDYSVPN